MSSEVTTGGETRAVGIRPMGLGESAILFGIPAVMLWVATHLCIPALCSWSGLPSTVCWFLCGGTLVFVPLTVASLILYRREERPFSWSHIVTRFRLTRPSLKTLIMSLLGVLLVGTGTYLVMTLAQKFLPGFSAHPSFMEVKPLEPGQYWILLAWLPFFFFNIVGELLFWRGYMFPRQELAFGKYTWLVHGSGWLLFHIAFGRDLLITLLPIIFVTPLLVQKTRSSWPDLVIHTVVNGSGFVLVSLGIVS